MFEHLPMITSIEVLGTKEIPEFQKLYKRCWDESERFKDFLRMLCSEAFKENPFWGDVVFMVAAEGLLQDINKLRLPPQVARAVKSEVAPSVIEWLWIILRSIDRELEAKELGKLMGEGGKK